MAFLSNRSVPGGEEGKTGKTQLWALALSGGEAWPVTRLERSVEDFGWVDDETLVIAAQEVAEPLGAAAQDSQGHLPESWTTRSIRPQFVSSSVWLGGADVEPLTRNSDWINELAVSPDGRHAVVTAHQSLSYEFDQKTPPRARLVDLATGEEKRLSGRWTVASERNCNGRQIQWASTSPIVSLAIQPIPNGNDR